jgi:hypothetical protein
MTSFTHNLPSFDAVVEESLLRGLYLLTSMPWSAASKIRGCRSAIVWCSPRSYNGPT